MAAHKAGKEKKEKEMKGAKKSAPKHAKKKMK